MRFRPANISLINRRHYLPRLLLTLFSKGQMQKPPQRFEDVDRVTPYQGRDFKTESGIASARRQSEEDDAGQGTRQNISGWQKKNCSRTTGTVGED